jgi:hypothetical protein
VRERGGDAEPARESAAPEQRMRGARVPLRRGRAGWVDERGTLGRDQGREHECRLQRHADPFADDRVRLACRVADPEQRTVGVDANAGSERPAREPRPVAARVHKRGADAGAFPAQHRLERVAGTNARLRRPKRLQPVGTDAAGERCDAVFGDDYPP